MTDTFTVDQGVTFHAADGRLMTLVLDTKTQTPNAMLRAVGEDGKTAWYANFTPSIPFEAEDSIVSITAKLGIIAINTFQCWRYELSAGTGTAFSKTFTK